MDRQTLPRWARSRGAAVWLLAVSSLIGAADPASVADTAATPYVTVQAQAISHARHAYGQVEPMAVVQVRVVDPGTLSGLRVVSGSAVKAGEVLASVGGPRMQALLIASAQALRSAKARDDAANFAVQVVRRQVAMQLATVQALNAAQNELAVAGAAVRTAVAQMQEARHLQTVRAPVAGTVLAVQAANGEQLGSGQAVLTLQPAGRLWIRAEFYGAGAARPRIGMTGRFQPSGAGHDMAVKVVAISPAMATDGGVRIGLLPTTSDLPEWWINGQWGSLTLEGSTRLLVLVPTQALILDRGHWWVLVHTATGNEARQVEPGPARGWQTAIVSGLEPGKQVVVTDAFLEYHRGIASHYTPPD